MNDHTDTPAYLQARTADQARRGDSSPNAIARETRIQDAVEQVGQILVSLEERLEFLASKLAPVLLPENEKSSNSDMTVPETSDMHYQILRINFRLNSLSYELNRVIARVDL